MINTVVIYTSQGLLCFCFVTAILYKSVIYYNITISAVSFRPNLPAVPVDEKDSLNTIS